MTANTAPRLASARRRKAYDVASPPERLGVVGLTILAHPDRRRVGETARLSDLATGCEIELSGAGPAFEAADGRDRRPLEDPHLSRRPVLLAPGAEAGSVSMDCRFDRTAVEVAGASEQGIRLFSAGEIARGVVLLLRRRVALLLHPMPAPGSESTADFGLVGASAAIRRLRWEISLAAPLDVPVLLRGETGTGKDLVARAIHEAGPRNRRPFVAVNMGAIPPSLAASELFGAARGAFTGASSRKTGFFRHAHRGTLFLDEIGETPIEVQALLLRALENGEIQPVGSVQRETVDVRVITATDAEIESKIAGGHFRGPLYYRLAGYLIHLPALRQRRDDIGRLLFHFLAEELGDFGGGLEASADEAAHPWPPASVVDRLARYDWPGNVRELRNVARRLAIARRVGAGWNLDPLLDEILARSAEPVIAAAVSVTGQPSPGASSPISIPISAHGVGIPCRRRFRKLTDVSDEELLAALKDHGWQPKPAAAALGVSRANLYRLIEASPRLRTASDLSQSEIERVLERCSDDVAAAAAELEVSAQGLKLRLKALGKG